MTNYENEAKTLRKAAYPTPGAFAAGGAITSVFTNQPINDVDVYFKSREQFEFAVESAYEDGFWCVDSSKRAVTFSNNGGTPIQYMHFDFYPTAEDIFKAFDFTVCMAAYDYDAQEFVFHPDFLKHNSQRFLRFNPGTRFPIASAARTLKYQARGYTLGKGDMIKIALACRGVEINTWEDLKDQIGGAYGEKVIIGSEDKEFTLDAAIDALSVGDDGEEFWIARSTEAQPGSSMELLRKLADLKGEYFDESRFDADGYIETNKTVLAA